MLALNTKEAISKQLRGCIGKLLRMSPIGRPDSGTIRPGPSLISFLLSIVSDTNNFV
jgi:hypothetical protein